jgi:hypothetical protein
MARFATSRVAAELTRATERRSIDSLDIDKSQLAARELAHYTRGWGVTQQTLVKIARKMIERQISPMRVAELIETALIRHKLPPEHPHHVRNRGGFVVGSIKKELVKNGFSWNEGEDDQ